MLHTAIVIFKRWASGKYLGSLGSVVNLCCEKSKT